MRDQGLLELCAGEIVGLGGLVGCGKTELARALFGLCPVTKGSFTLDDQEIQDPTPATMLSKGLIYLPQDRRGEALALNRSISDNIVLEVLRDAGMTRTGIVNVSRLAALVDGLLTRLGVTPKTPDKKVIELSGGNQQKVGLGRALSKTRRVFLFDEPTSGVDVGARLDFYRQLKILCAEGAAVLLVTSDLQELLHLSHRAYIMAGGRLVAHPPKDQMKEETVVAHAFGDGLEKGAQI